MTRLRSRTIKALAAVTLVTVLSACSSGESTPVTAGNPGGSTPPDNVPQTPTIQGIATPSSVSVVTATNAD